MPPAWYKCPRIGNLDRTRVLWLAVKETLIFLEIIKISPRETANEEKLEHNKSNLMFKSQNLDNYTVVNY